MLNSTFANNDTNFNAELLFSEYLNLEEVGDVQWAGDSDLHNLPVNSFEAGSQTTGVDLQVSGSAESDMSGEAPTNYALDYVSRFSRFVAGSNIDGARARSEVMTGCPQDLAYEGQIPVTNNIPCSTATHSSTQGQKDTATGNRISSVNNRIHVRSGKRGYVTWWKAPKGSIFRCEDNLSSGCKKVFTSLLDAKNHIRNEHGIAHGHHSRKAKMCRWGGCTAVVAGCPMQHIVAVHMQGMWNQCYSCGVQATEKAEEKHVCEVRID